MQTTPKIILLGATGFTGQLIAENLFRASVPFCLGGRSAQKLSDTNVKLNAGLPFLTLDIYNDKEIQKTLSAFDIVINCIGPYNLFGKNLLNYCRKNGKVYMDISGEQNFIKESFENKEEAKKSGASIIHSVSFESCLADLIASDILDTSVPYSDISSYYSFTKSKPSGGTRLTMQTSKHFPSYVLENGELKESVSLSFNRDIDFDFTPGLSKAFFMPYPEVLFFQNKYKVSNSASYLLANNSEAMFLYGSSNQVLPSMESILKKHELKTHVHDNNERSAQEFTLVIEAKTEDGKKVTKHINGNDMYGLTAFLVSRTVINILNGNKLPAGVLSPSEMGGWKGIWDELKKEKFITHIS